MISRRTRLSLCQLLDLWGRERSYLGTFLEKHFVEGEINWAYSDVHGVIHAVVLEATQEKVLECVRELARTVTDIRERVSPAERFDERMMDLVRCLALDGYHIQNGTLVAVDPLAAVDPPLEDELSQTLRSCAVPSASKVVALLVRSSEAFTRQAPDYNACLTHARMALETFARSLAAEVARAAAGPAPTDRWGDAVAELRRRGFISQQEERALTSVYTFASDGAHRLLGLTDEETARLGRLLLIGMLFFLAKRAIRPERSGGAE